MILLLALFALASNSKPESVLIDLQSGAVIREDWQEASPVGSLIKPFAALAYAATHNYQYPNFTCDGHACWLRKGHGQLAIREALACSCNGYFAQLTAKMSPEELSIVLRRFGLDSMPASASHGNLYGIGDAWRGKPADLLRAYAELVSRSEEPGVRELLDGMALAANSGTGRALGPSVLAKTGTAPCIHRRRASGDGYALAIYPRNRPERAILMRIHGGTGMQSAVALKREMDVLGHN